MCIVRCGKVRADHHGPNHKNAFGQLIQMTNVYATLKTVENTYARHERPVDRHTMCLVTQGSKILMR